MTIFLVDASKCKQDGICADGCPMGIIEFTKQDPIPRPTKDAAAFCIQCGHCVAICPEGALSHSAMTPQQCPPVKREWLLSKEKVVHFLRSRRSIRNYKGRIVPREQLAELIDVARFAPSGHNVQPVRWHVIYDKEELQRLAAIVIDWMRTLVNEGNPLAEQMHMDRVVTAWESGTDRICRGAPHVIVVHAPQEERTAPAACTIALTYLELAAPSYGLGACWAGYFNMAANMWSPMLKALGLPAGHNSFGAMMVGYPKYKYVRLPLRKKPSITWK